MRSVLCMVVVCLFAAAFAADTVTAAPFEPLFRITSVMGDCSVQPPQEKTFVKAEEGKAYPFGTVIKTGRNSSVTVQFSEGNECRILANTTLTVSEDAMNKQLKILKLKDGHLDVSLEEGFEEHNQLNVETATAICGAIGCKFSVDSETRGDLVIVLVVVEEGQVRVYWTDFDALLDDGDSLSVSGSRAEGFLRIRNVKGTIPVEIKDAEGNPKTVEMLPGSVIKIWRRQTDSGVAITILILTSDGELAEAINYIEKKEGGRGPTEEEMEREEPGRDKGAGQEPGTDIDRRLREFESEFLEHLREFLGQEDRKTHGVNVIHRTGYPGHPMAPPPGQRARGRRRHDVTPTGKR